MKSNMFNLIVYLIILIGAIACEKSSTESENNNPPSTTETVTDIDGNVYQTIKIGNQWWMAENLKVTHYRNGDPIDYVIPDSIWKILISGAYCKREDVSYYLDTYGCLYNWYAVNDVRNIAPAGWHVSTDAEWQTLVDTLGGGYIAGGKLKENGTEHWNSPNVGATNESGFTGLPGSHRLGIAGQYGFIGVGAEFWTSTPFDTTAAWYRGLNFNHTIVVESAFYYDYGLSVRCVKD